MSKASHMAGWADFVLDMLIHITSRYAYLYMYVPHSVNKHIIHVHVQYKYMC